MVVAIREKSVPQRHELAERAKGSFELFIKEAWPSLEPSTPLMWNWHIEALAIHLQALYHREITRLLIGIAPGHAKSSIVSVLFPVWCWINDPYSRWLCASHAEDLAIRDNGNRRRLIDSDWFQDNYGDIFHFAKDQNLKSFFQNNKKGYMMAIGVRGSGTGKRCTHALIDDAHNAMEGEKDREKVIQWFGKTFISRLNDQKNGPMCVVGQRLHTKDLPGHIIELGGWEHLCLPEEFVSSRRCFTSVVSRSDDPYAWKGTDPRKEEGELLWKEKFPKEVLDKLKHDMGVPDYEAQYQQGPTPPGGYTFNQAYERLFTIDQEAKAYLLETPRGIKPVRIQDCWHASTSDVAAKEKEKNDWTVFSTWAITSMLDVLLLDVRRAHWTIPEQEEEGYKVFLAFNSETYQCLYFEDVGYQSAIAQHLIPKGVPCLPFPVAGKGDKVFRAGPASIWLKLGKVYFLKNAHWLNEWQTEIYAFPKSEHDDQVDTFSMICLIIRKPRPGVHDESTANKIDTTLSIEQILDADEIAKEQAEQDAKKQEEEAKNPAQSINPFEWAAMHEGGTW